MYTSGEIGEVEMHELFWPTEDWHRIHAFCDVSPACNCKCKDCRSVAREGTWMRVHTRGLWPAEVEHRDHYHPTRDSEVQL